MVAERLLSAGILTKETHRNTIRLAPPFIITETEIDWAVSQIADVLAALSKEVVEPIAGLTKAGARVSMCAAFAQWS